MLFIQEIFIRSISNYIINLEITIVSSIYMCKFINQRTTLGLPPLPPPPKKKTKPPLTLSIYALKFTVCYNLIKVHIYIYQYDLEHVSIKFYGIHFYPVFNKRPKCHIAHLRNVPLIKASNSAMKEVYEVKTNI